MRAAFKMARHQVAQGETWAAYKGPLVGEIVTVLRVKEGEVRVRLASGRSVSLVMSAFVGGDRHFIRAQEAAACR